MQRLERRRRCVAGLIRVVLALCVVVPISSVLAQDDPFGADWPEGEGRALTGALCGGCHSLNLVKQQGLTRDGWDGLLVWMSEKQNMPPLAGDMRDTVLDYLADNFGIESNALTAPAGNNSRLPPLTPTQGINHQPILGIREPKQ